MSSPVQVFDGLPPSDAVPVAERLFTWPAADPRLLGARCVPCSALTFPAADSCPRCGQTAMQDEELLAQGTLWTWTSQGFLPKAPYSGPQTDEAFTPWVVAVVELPGQLRLEALLVDCALEDCEVGLPVELRIIPWGVTSDGQDRVSFAFAPVQLDQGESA